MEPIMKNFFKALGKGLLAVGKAATLGALAGIATHGADVLTNPQGALNAVILGAAGGVAGMAIKTPGQARDAATAKSAAAAIRLDAVTR